MIFIRIARTLYDDKCYANVQYLLTRATAKWLSAVQNYALVILESHLRLPTVHELPGVSAFWLFWLGVRTRSSTVESENTASGALWRPRDSLGTTEKHIRWRCTH